MSLRYDRREKKSGNNRIPVVYTGGIFLRIESKSVFISVDFYLRKTAWSSVRFPAMGNESAQVLVHAKLSVCISDVSVQVRHNYFWCTSDLLYILFRYRFYRDRSIRWKGKEENETSVVSFSRGVLSLFGPLVRRNCPVCFGWCARFVPNFRLRQQAYSVYLDPWHAGVCFICFGWYARCASKLQSKDVLCH
jgi:hypothetical protein